jgi:hypothetical protein
VSATVAPGITPPLGSLTVPETLPPAWAEAHGLLSKMTRMANTTQRAKRIFFVNDGLHHEARPRGAFQHTFKRHSL